MSALAEWPEFQQDPAQNNHKQLRTFDADIQRFAHYTANAGKPYAIDSEDLAQQARLHLLKTPILDKSDAYVRSAIFNAARDARRTELKFLSHTEPLTAPEMSPKAIEAPDVALIDVHQFVEQLPARLRSIYEVLYVRDCDQRTAAAELGISQPRVAKLHAELLKRGRKYFGVAIN